MKDYRQANRGRSFENFVRFANSRYAHEGLAMVEKIPTEFLPIRNAYGKIVSAKVEKKSSVDFIGRYKNYPLAMEVKNTNKDNIRFDAVEEHQAAFLDRFDTLEGIICLVLVSFKFERFFAIPWAFWGAAYDERVRKKHRSTKATAYFYGMSWDIPLKNSIRAEDIPQEFEVPGNDPRYGLHYLINAEKYLNIERSEDNE